MSILLFGKTKSTKDYQRKVAILGYPLGTSKRRFLYVSKADYLLLVDAFSKWSEVFKMISATASSTISRLKDVFSRFRNPKVLVSDNGPQFT
jgi:transposase InsO family protein